MALRILWDRDEALILLDGLLSVLNGDQPRLRVVKSVSQELRSRAVGRGIEIDEVFRNENGIRMRMSEMEYIYTNGEKGLKTNSPSRVFQEVVTLYRSDRYTFERLLKEAKKLPKRELYQGSVTLKNSKTKENVEINEEPKNYENEKAHFIDWAAKSGIQYSTARSYANNIDKCTEISRELRLIQGDLFSVKDVGELEQIKAKLLNNSDFQEMNRRWHNAFKAAINKLIGFRKENGEPNSKVSSEQCMDTSKKNKKNIQSVKTVDFSQANIYAHTKPISLLYNNQTYDITSWRELYVKLCSILFEDHNDQFMTIINGDAFGHNSFLFVDEANKNSVITPRSFAKGYYLESNLSANSIVNRVGKLRQMFNLENSLSIFYQQATGKSKSDKRIDNDLPSINEKKDESLIEGKLIEIESFVLEADLDGVTIDDIASRFNMPVLSVKKCIQSSMSMVSICGRLIHKDAFVDWEIGANCLQAVLDKLMNKNDGYVSAVQLYDYTRLDLAMFMNDNNMNDERKIYDMAEHLFEKEKYHGIHYIFQSKAHISRPTDTVSSKLDIIKKYARNEGGFICERELEEHLQGLGIKSDHLRQYLKLYDDSAYLFYEPGYLITSESMGIDNKWLEKLKKALNALLNDTDGHVIIRDIQPWWYQMLPELPNSKLWTPLLLQSVLRFYGEEIGVKTICALETQSIDTLHAMIVSLEGEIQTFSDAVLSIFIDNQISKVKYSAEELRQLLIEYGLISGRELIYTMHDALPSDGRFIWDINNKNVTINI